MIKKQEKEPQRKKIVIRSSRKRRVKGRALAFLQEYKLIAVAGVLAILGILIVVAVLSVGQTDLVSTSSSNIATPVSGNSKNLLEPDIDFPFPELLPYGNSKIDPNVQEEVITRNGAVGAFLRTKGLSVQIANEVADQAHQQSLREFEEGHKLYTFKLLDGTAGSISKFFIYEIRFDLYAIITLHPSPAVVIQQLDLEREIRSLDMIMRNSLFWDTYIKENANPQLADQITEALKWQVDLYHVEANDRFKMIFEDQVYKGEKVGKPVLIGGTYWERGGKAHYFFRYNDPVEGYQYYDESGAQVRRRFLMSPVEYNIINSPFNLERFHPIHKEVRPHYGTDYFAHRNDPVFAIGDGVVTIAGHTGGNGNYVKIRHDDTYESQYLHLTGFATGIRKGTRVKQGDVIGYAGDTGLAQGVHVCFRFWQNNKQVDHTKLPIFSSGTQGSSVRDRNGFLTFRDRLIDEFYE